MHIGAARRAGGGGRLGRRKRSGDRHANVLDEAIHVLPQVHAALDHDRPDLVLYDIGGMAGPVAAEQWGVPTAQLSPSEVAWEGYHEDMAEILGPILGSPSGLAYRQAFDDWLADSGTGLTFDEVTGVPRRCLVLIPRVMQRNADRVGDRYRFVGPCIDPRREDPRDWSAPPGDGPLALLAFGTANTDRADVYRNVIEALDGQDWRLVLAAGRADVGVVPAWVQLRDTVPQPAVLRAADCFITHAGMGSCTEGLWYGVPMVAIPQAVDQPANAARLETIGVGRRLTDRLPSVVDIRDAVLGVASSHQVRTTLDAISAEIHAHGGPGHAADAVEDFAAGRW
ncbi:nucleotide disphospho-sugar-binding domain-containing protein [Mycolicibacterium sp. HK-90]|uniref:nucleotide disphospho-sugar-binding domain-containing protein n=1 Tax=Mycolicibacterium sp. HK-90 TaxID=3056937 RepID=UPI00265ADCF3|nr:nucleotide disphospho-sugar-binding domain-containing protein [Mycolicibacterium sp. HK-90]WKG04260.1 glycosyltransferase [Mycolicibacterium sp. HK-90]